MCVVSPYPFPRLTFSSQHEREVEEKEVAQTQTQTPKDEGSFQCVFSHSHHPFLRLNLTRRVITPILCDKARAISGMPFQVWKVRAVVPGLAATAAHKIFGQSWLQKRYFVGVAVLILNKNKSFLNVTVLRVVPSWREVRIHCTFTAYSAHPLHGHVHCAIIWTHNNMMWRIETSILHRQILNSHN